MTSPYLQCFGLANSISAMDRLALNELADYGGSRALIEALIEALAATGFKEFYPPQELSLKAGLLSGNESFVVAAPTASGKTLIAEMAVLKTIFEGGGKVVYLVPLRALAREKYEDFKKRYGRMRVILSTGDYDSAEPWLYDADLIIATNEKMDSLIRHRAPWLKDLALVVADEIHLIGESGRGPTLEVVLTRLRSIRPGLRILALSATIPNAEDFARWLGAKLVRSDWRPVPLREGVFFNGAIIFGDGSVKWTRGHTGSDAVDLALDTVAEGGQALIFVNTRKATEAVAKKAAEELHLEGKALEPLGLLAGEVLNVVAEPTRICRKLSECVSRGSAFHHAGINYSQRKLIEDAFRDGRLKVIASTTTLAMGLNLPSRRVVIRDWYRYASGLGMRSLPAIEIKQMSGRAGRPGYDEYGEAVIIARNKKDEEQLFRKYITGKPEKIESRLGSEPALRTHILAAIAGLFAGDREELADFLGGTFCAVQEGTSRLALIADNVIGFLVDEEMITEKNGTLHATRFGRRVSELYIDPLSGVILRDAMRRPEKKEPFPVLHAISRAPDMMRLALKKKDYEEMLDLFHVHLQSLLLPDEQKYVSEELLAELKTASVVMQWILEMPEDRIVGHFGIGPGDLRTLVDRADWLLYSAQEIGKTLNIKDINLLPLRARVRYGIKEELLELVSLKGIGRVRARNLYDAGFRTLKDLTETNVEQISQVPAMGTALAENIKKQLGAIE